MLIDVDFFLRYRARFSERDCGHIWAQMRRFVASAFGEGAICRFSSGDEMAVLLPSASREEAAERADRVRRAFRRQNFLPPSLAGYAPLRMSFSAGVVACPQDGVDPDRLSRLAVSALFLAKAGRRNQVAVLSTSTGPAQGRRLWDTRLSVQTVLGRWGRVGRVSASVNATQGLLYEPQAVAADGMGRLFVADTDNHQALCLEGGQVFPVAGCGEFGYTGDEGPATRARLNKPTALCVHGQKLLIADTGNDAVREVDLRTGLIRTLVGCGQAGYTGDGGPAAQARLNKPGGVAVDRWGNVYIDDIANNVVRRVLPNGVIEHFAGTGEFGFGGDGGPARQALFNEIYGIGADWRGERLYLADYGNHRVRQIDLASGMVSTIAGTGRAEYSGDKGEAIRAGLCRPVAVCGDAMGNVLIADAGNSAVRIVTPDGLIFTLAGGLGPGVGRDGPVTGFALCNPNSLAVSHSIYLLDGANNRLCRLYRPPHQQRRNTDGKHHN